MYVQINILTTDAEKKMTDVIGVVVRWRHALLVMLLMPLMLTHKFNKLYLLFNGFYSLRSQVDVASVFGKIKIKIK